MTSFRPLRLAGRVLLLLLFIATARIPVIAAESGPASPAGVGCSWIFSDFDGDQKPDLAELHRSSLHLRLSTGDQQHLVIPPHSDGSEAEIVAADIDGDSDLDIVVRDRFAAHYPNVWLNNGKGTFTEHSLGHNPLPLEKSTWEQFRSAVPDLGIPIEPPKSKAVFIAISFAPSCSSDSAVYTPPERHTVHFHEETSRLRAPPATSLA